jgi:hypothetical protein
MRRLDTDGTILHVGHYEYRLPLPDGSTVTPAGLAGLLAEHVYDRRHSKRNPTTAVSPPTRPPCASTTPRSPAGCRHTTPLVNSLSFRSSPGPPAVRASRRACGVTAAERQGPARVQAGRVWPVQGRPHHHE